MTCEALSNCLKTAFFPVVLVVIVTGSLLVIGFKPDIDEELRKQLGAFIVDSFSAALAYLSATGGSNE